MNVKKRVRYAPSPTGFLHIGNARTALFNYLFASHYEGVFIIRIEDTDLCRNIENSEQNQLRQLKWLGINWSEGPDCGGPFGPYRQSERLNIYSKYAQILLDKKMAYKEYKQNDCKKYVIRFRVSSNQDKKYEFNDLVRGCLSFQSKEIEDWILIKENGFPTYNFAAAIDDHLMGITHILRGEEHITNTPKQIMIYNAFNWSVPIFGHISLILNKNGKKLSKRDENSTLHFIQKYIDMGFLPNALFNFLSLLGFYPSASKEILEPKELIELFDVKKLIKSPAVFDDKKLFFINNQYIKKIPILELVEIIKPFFVKENIFLDQEFLQKLTFCFQDRISYLEEIVKLYNVFFIKKLKLNDQQVEFIKKNVKLDVLKTLYDYIYNLKFWNEDIMNKLISFFQEKSGLKGKDLFLTLRIICTYRNEGPHLINYLNLLGKSKILNNIEKFFIYLN
ncbi:glutamate--tRNA ligase [Candidatus Phytoplasma oryzae]|nr:glutamate--tRNA ligase [Candidatus Phytoplasma oryzae]